VVTDHPLETILCNPNVIGRVVEWAVELLPFEISFETTKVIKSKALAKFTAEWTDPFADEPLEVESTLLGEEAPGLWVMHFDGAFNLPGAGAGAVLTSPSGDKLFYAVQLYFKPEHKVSNNIVEYEGLLAGLRAANALGIKRLVIKGDSQLVVNFSNKSYTPKDEHMAAYLEEHRKMEKRFQGLELKHIPRGENVEADEIAKRTSHRLAQSASVFEERLFKLSASPSSTGSDLPPALPAPPEQEAPDYGPPSGDRVLLALARQEGVDWILELKAFLISSRLPEDESEAERIVRQASRYCVKDGDLYRRRSEVHIYSPRPRASQGHSRRRVWASCFYFNPRRKGISKWLLLAFSALGRGGDGQEVRGMPIPCQADSSAGAGTANHATHLALCCLGARHSWSIP
jgi:ribonuclease HI